MQRLFVAVFSTVTFAAATISAQQDSVGDGGGGEDPGGWRPEIPRVWDDDEIGSIELPLPSVEHSPRHVTSDFYYAIPALRIYRSYSVYHPDHEPSGYWEWLHEQEPEVVFNPAELRTKEDWIRAGELVFHEGHQYSTGIEMEFVRDREAYEIAGIPITADGRFPYSRYFVREKGTVELGTDACATCHTRVLDDGSVLEGGPGDFPLGPTLAYETHKEMARRASGADLPIVDESRGAYRNYAVPWLDPDPGAVVLGRTLTEVARYQRAIPAGVMARERTSLLTPVRVPDLFGIERRAYLDATGLVRHRSIGDLMRYAALNQGGDDLSSYGGFVVAADEEGNLPDPSTLIRYSDEQLYALALFLYSLEPPPSPHPPDAEAELGRAIFERQECDACHPPPDYTNHRLVPAESFVPTREHRRTLRSMNRRVGTDPALTMRTRRGTGYYKVPSLLGSWYKPRFFHDGSLSSLEEVFDPARLHGDYVPSGFRGAGVVRRAVPGHEYGLDLSAEDRARLVSFLKTL